MSAASPAVATATGSGLPLDTLAKDINARLGKSEDMRLSAATQLAEAHRRVVVEREAGNISWELWCSQNIMTRGRDGTLRALGQREIRLLLSVARAEDPAEALAAERGRARAGMAELRQKRVEPASRYAAPIAEIEALQAKMATLFAEELALREPVAEESKAAARRRTQRIAELRQQQLDAEARVLFARLFGHLGQDAALELQTAFESIGALLIEKLPWYVVEKWPALAENYDGVVVPADQIGGAS